MKKVKVKKMLKKKRLKKSKADILARKHNVPSVIFDIEESDEVAEQYHEMFGY